MLGQECDIRITHVPARDWPVDSKRPVFRERLAYPRLLETLEDNIHGEEYLVGTVDTTIYPWEPQSPILYVDQVDHFLSFQLFDDLNLTTIILSNRYHILMVIQWDTIHYKMKNN